MPIVNINQDRRLSIVTQDHLTADGVRILVTVYELDDDGRDIESTFVCPVVLDEEELEDRYGSAYQGDHMHAAEEAAKQFNFDGELWGAYHGDGKFVFVAV